jgi:predicted 3-demethylubiquinone-9 3-methyltransferase (glyoxalase superfamily)
MTDPIYPCLWFDGQARAAAELYGGAFGDLRIISESPVVVSFTLHGQKFMGLNGGPMYKPNPAISLYVTCEATEEIDQAWTLLSEGGGVLMPLDSYPWSSRYGWLEDRFGVSWQLAAGKLKDVGRKFAPMLMFTGAQAGRAEEAVRYYASLFEPSSIVGIRKYGPGESEKEGAVNHAQFWLGEQVFMAMDSSPHAFAFGEGVSLVVTCGSQQAIDHYWARLADGGQEGMCGWLKDRFGVSWQVVPAILGELMRDPARAPRVTEAFLKMKKLDIEALIRA